MRSSQTILIFSTGQASRSTSRLYFKVAQFSQQTLQEKNTRSFLSETWSKRSTPGLKDEPSEALQSAARANEWRFFRRPYRDHRGKVKVLVMSTAGAVALRRGVDLLRSQGAVAGADYDHEHQPERGEAHVYDTQRLQGKRKLDAEKNQRRR